VKHVRCHVAAVTSRASEHPNESSLMNRHYGFETIGMLGRSDEFLIGDHECEIVAGNGRDVIGIVKNRHQE
jgi:hypothetical protein